MSLTLSSASRSSLATKLGVASFQAVACASKSLAFFVQVFNHAGSFPLSRNALYVASLSVSNCDVACGATLNAVLGQILYVLVLTGHPLGDP